MRKRSVGLATAKARSEDQLLIDGRSDPEAFGEFFDRTYDDVLGYFAARVRSPETAADLCAETLAAVLEGIDRFDPTLGVARQWLFGIARNQLSRYWRDLRVSNEARDRLGMRRVEPDVDTLAAIARIEAEADFRLVLEALDRLPPDQADAVRLRVFEQLEYKEIAVRLECKEGAVRVRVHRGLRRLELGIGT